LASFVLSKYKSTFAEGTFVGDNWILVLMASVVFSVSLISGLSSLKIIRRLGEIIMSHRDKISGVLLLCLSPLLLHEVVFYLFSPIFAHFRGL
jgi:small neutral amino acid transporter SnatA (MarC family)